MGTFKRVNNLRVILIIWLFVFSIHSFGQTSKIDSLKSVIRGQKNDREKVDNLVELANQFAKLYELDSLCLYAQTALEISENIDYLKGIAESHYKISLADGRRDNFQKGLQHLHIYCSIYDEIGDEKKLAKGWYALGTIFSPYGEKDSALYYFKKSLSINLKYQDTLIIFAAYNGIGTCYQELSNQDSAAYYLIKAAEMAEASGMTQYLGHIYNNLAKNYTRLKDFDKAYYYARLALDYARQIKDPKLLAQTLTNMGLRYYYMDKPDTALWYYDESEKVISSIGNTAELGDIYNNRAKAYLMKGDERIALENFYKSLEIYRQVNYPEGTFFALQSIGEVYSQSGLYAKAALYLDSSLSLASQVGYDMNRNKILELIASNYYEWGNYYKAYEYLSRFKNLNDSLFTLEKSKMVHELEVKYQKQKDQAMILTLEKENLKKTIQRNAILYGSIGLFMIALFLILFFRQRAKKDKIIAEQKIRQLEEEKKLMSAKLLVEGQEEERKRIARELHDGLGVLLSATKMQFSSLRLSIPENKELFDRAVKLLEQASGDVRKISHNMMPGLLTKLGFFEAVEDLVDNIKDIKGMHAECIIEGDQERLPENKEIMLYRVVQEMVNNSIKHAQAKNIILKINRSAQELHLTFEDDGNGFDVEKVLNSPTASLGLKSIQSRIGFLNGDVSIESSPGQGVRYTVRIPI